MNDICTQKTTACSFILTFLMPIALAAMRIGWGIICLFILPINAYFMRKKRSICRRCLGSCVLWILLTVLASLSSYFFYRLVKFRTARGDWSATQKYKTAKNAGITYSNNFMRYNQEIQDDYRADEDKERWKEHPVWYMRNFPKFSVSKDADNLIEDARVNYCRVWQEEGWSQMGPMGPRLFWADQFHKRAQVEYTHRFMYSDAYKRHLGDLYEELPKEPSW